MPLIDLGMDSLMAVRIRNTARADFGAEPPVALLLQGASPADLTAELVRQLGLISNRGSRANRDSPRQSSAASRGAQQAAVRRKRGQST